MQEDSLIATSGSNGRLLHAVRQRFALILGNPWAMGFLILALSAAVRCGDLDAMVNVDMYIFWNRRIARFIAAVNAGDYQQTVQSHHPGVMFMWLAGLLWKAFGIVDARLDPVKLRLAVWPVVVVGSLFPAASYAVLRRLLGNAHRLAAGLIALLFATEPMLVAHSRNAHLDVLVTSFAWLAVLCALVAKRELSLLWSVASGLLLGLALLSKLSAAGYALGIALVFGSSSLQAQRRSLKLTVRLGCIAAVSAAVVVALWPAMWVGPEAVIERLHSGLTTEVDKTGPFMFLGKTGKLDLPFWIYGVFVIYLVTPEFFAPGLLLLTFWRRLDVRVQTFAWDAVMASAPLIFLVLQSNHVGNRYLIPMLPILGTLGGLGLAAAIQLLKVDGRPSWQRQVARVIVPTLLVGRLARLMSLYPLPITYCSGWTGVDCSRVFHTGWGEGMREAAQFVRITAQNRGYGGAVTVYGDAYAATMAVWTPLVTTRDLEQAHLLIQYLPNRQRRVPISEAIEEYVTSHAASPLYEVKMSGRTYVTIYPGPRY